MAEAGVTKLVFAVDGKTARFLYGHSADYLPFVLDEDAGQLKCRTPLADYPGGPRAYLEEMGTPGMSIALESDWFEDA